jgi:hypothetical protein
MAGASGFMTEACQYLHDVLSSLPRLKREDLAQVPKNGILYKSNKDRSIFRKHVGRCLLAKTSDPFLSQWELNLTAKASRLLNEGKVDKVRLQEVEADVTRHMVENFSFAVLHFDDEADRRRYEENLLSTIYACPDCGPSEAWLGKYHPNSQVIRECGLWNVQGLSGAVSLVTRPNASLGLD